jgi:hypothetical protein
MHTHNGFQENAHAGAHLTFTFGGAIMLGGRGTGGTGGTAPSMSFLYARSPGIVMTDVVGWLLTTVDDPAVVLGLSVSRCSALRLSIAGLYMRRHYVLPAMSATAAGVSYVNAERGRRRRTADGEAFPQLDATPDYVAHIRKSYAPRGSWWDLLRSIRRTRPLYSCPKPGYIRYSRRSG